MNASKIDLDDLIMALSSRYELDDPSHYLDTQTGEVIYAGEGLEALPADLKDNPRYRWIEPVQPDIALGIMEEFISLVGKPDAAAQLRTAFEDNEPFEAFKEALATLPQLRDRWFLFHHQAYAALARAWIEQQQ